MKKSKMTIWICTNESTRACKPLTKEEFKRSMEKAVVAANNDDEARNILPGYSKFATAEQFGEWCSSPDKVKVECLGEAVKGIKKGVILASFRAS